MIYYSHLIFIFSAAYNIRQYKKNELLTNNADQSEPGHRPGHRLQKSFFEYFFPVLNSTGIPK